MIIGIYINECIYYVNPKLGVLKQIKEYGQLKTRGLLLFVIAGKLKHNKILGRVLV
jgi:hypothetical protein